LIIRGATGRKLHYGRVNESDILYFINNNTEGEVKAKGMVSSVFNSEKMTEDESKTLVKKHQDKLPMFAASHVRKRCTQLAKVTLAVSE
jgi:hypothetical protein